MGVGSTTLALFINHHAFYEHFSFEECFFAQKKYAFIALSVSNPFEWLF